MKLDEILSFGTGQEKWRFSRRSMEESMRKAFLIAAATMMGGMVMAAAPSQAQPSVQFGIGPNGPTVDIDRRDHDRWDRRDHRGWRHHRRYDDMTTGSIDRCRTIVIHERQADGDRVTKRIRRCR
jgi:hypothetical protein